MRPDGRAPANVVVSNNSTPPDGGIVDGAPAPRPSTTLPFTFSRAPPSKPYTQTLGSNPGRSAQVFGRVPKIWAERAPLERQLPYEGDQLTRGFDTRARDIFFRRPS